MADVFFTPLPSDVARLSNTSGDVPEVEAFVRSAFVEPVAESDVRAELKRPVFFGKHQYYKKKKSAARRGKKYIGKKERRELMLTKIGRKHLKFNDLLELNSMWNSYMLGVLELSDFTRIPTREEWSWEEFGLKILKADFHGAEFQIVRSTCPSYVGLRGICAMETKNTILLVGNDDRSRCIPKDSSIFKVFVGGTISFTFVGKHIQYRPAERSTKKIKTKLIFSL